MIQELLCPVGECRQPLEHLACASESMGVEFSLPLVVVLHHCLKVEGRDICG